jgi:predicted lipoprotein with Yx(FWY)xxD motif
MKSLIRIVLPLCLVAAAGAGAALATTSTSDSKATVKTVRNTHLGVVLVDAGGRALYRYTPDKRGRRTCAGACLAAWPPLVVKGSAKPVAGAGVQASLLGTIAAPHGLRQVTYAGYPLYRYRDDRHAGEFEGQGEGGAWYLVGSKGGLVKTPAGSSGGTGTTTTTDDGTTTNDNGGTTTDDNGGGGGYYDG